MAQLILQPATLYILSGVSGSGKSYLLNSLLSKGQITPDAIINPDTIRKNILGVSHKTDEHGSYDYLNGWDYANKEAFDISFKMLDLRLKQGLITFFDAVSLNDKSRRVLSEMAQAQGKDYKIIIFDMPIEKAKENLLNRLERFSPKVLDEQNKRFDRKSALNHFVYHPGVDEIYLLPNLIDTASLDVVGDTHGLLDDAKAIVKKLGWSYNEMENIFEHQDKARKIIFLGDVVDRGPKSFELLEIVKNMTDSGKAYFLLGNHENKLFKLLSDYESNRPMEKKSIASALSFKEYLKLSKDKQKSLFNYLKRSPAHYSIWIDKKTNLALTQTQAISYITQKEASGLSVQKIGFSHADVQTFNDYYNLRAHSLYGVKEGFEPNVDNDKKYQELFDKGINEHVYIRGHFPVKSKNKSVCSLDNRCAFAGSIQAMKLDAYLLDLKANNYVLDYSLFEKNLIEQQVKFNFNEYIKTIDLDKETNLVGIFKEPTKTLNNPAINKAKDKKRK